MNKKLIAIIFLIFFFFVIQASFAESAVSNVTSTHDSNQNLEVDNDKLEENPKDKTVFIISDNPGTNIIDSASDEIYNVDNRSGFKLVVRSGQQVKDMNESELYNLFDKSDAFIGEWISTDVDSVLTSLLGKYPNFSNKELFLILEPPSGNLNSGSSSLNLIRNNTINYQKILTSYSNAELIDYFKNTKRGESFTNIKNYIDGEGSRFNSILNQLILYKDLNDKDNLKNQILYVLNILGYDFPYNLPNFTGTKSYGI